MIVLMRAMFPTPGGGCHRLAEAVEGPALSTVRGVDNLSPNGVEGEAQFGNCPASRTVPDVEPERPSIECLEPFHHVPEARSRAGRKPPARWQARPIVAHSHAKMWPVLPGGDLQEACVEPLRETVGDGVLDERLEDQ